MKLHLSPRAALAPREANELVEVKECPNLAAAAAVEALEPIQVGGPEPAAQPQTPATAAPCPEGVVTAGYTEPKECEEALMPPCMPEVAEDAVLMPMCCDEEETATFMPYVEEDPEAKHDLAFPFNLWFYWLKARGATGDSHEQEMVPEAPRGEPVGPEGFAPTHRAGTPDCQVDPGYPHEYSGCPHMGGCCPNSGHCLPPAPPADKPVEKKSKKVIKAHPTSLFHFLLPGKSELPVEDDCTSRGAVDTMECRPMDVKNAGFDPNEPF
jgi:hypothetical protein